MNKNSNNLSLIISIIIIFLFFFIFLPIFDNIYKIKEQLENINLPNETNLLFPDNSTGIPKLDNNKCSKNCCNRLTQWKIPSELYESDNKHDYSKYIPSNISCKSNDTVGCLCVTNDNLNYLQSRGSNL